MEEATLNILSTNYLFFLHDVRLKNFSVLLILEPDLSQSPIFD